MGRGAAGLTDPSGGPAVVEVRRFGAHRNGFGFLRLLFASLVIVSHAAEMADGDRGREAMTWLFGTLTFGELAVDGFFLVSGFLITGSFLKDRRLWPYLRRRLVRLYPAFLVATAVCFLLVGPLAGMTVAEPLRLIVRAAVYAIGLQPPPAPGVFATLPYPILNGSMWTIAYEARCYLLVPLVAATGLFGSPRALLAVAVACVCASVALDLSGSMPNGQHPHRAMVLGEPIEVLRLTGFFFVGAGVFLLRDRLVFSGGRAVVAAAVLVACLFVEALAEPALATAGAYLLFGFALEGGAGWASRINNRTDISYGVYLYALPINQLLLWYWRDVPLVLAMVTTLALAVLCGWLSWAWVERPMLERFRTPSPERTAA